MSAVGVMAMPHDFRYKEVFLKGKPRHDRFDSFRIRHPRMEIGHRAKIFSPFDALKGFNEAIASKDVLYEYRKELSDEDQAELNRRIQILHNLTWNKRMARANHVVVSITYFEPCKDENHEAFGSKGQYKLLTGICWQVDADEAQTIQIDGKSINFDDILKIDGKGDTFTRDWENDSFGDGGDE